MNRPRLALMAVRPLPNRLYARPRRTLASFQLTVSLTSGKLRSGTHRPAGECVANASALKKSNRIPKLSVRFPHGPLILCVDRALRDPTLRHVRIGIQRDGLRHLPGKRVADTLVVLRHGFARCAGYSPPTLSACDPSHTSGMPSRSTARRAGAGDCRTRCIGNSSADRGSRCLAG